MPRLDQRQSWVLSGRWERRVWMPRSSVGMTGERFRGLVLAAIWLQAALGLIERDRKIDHGVTCGDRPPKSKTPDTFPHGGLNQFLYRDVLLETRCRLSGHRFMVCGP